MQNIIIIEIKIKMQHQQIRKKKYHTAKYKKVLSESMIKNISASFKTPIYPISSRPHEV